MTIAEVFLLLMFVVWLGNVIESTPGEGDPNITIAMLRERIGELERKNAALVAERTQLMAEIEALKIMAANWQRKYETATRGAPKCVPDSNVLANFSVVDGVVTGVVSTTDDDVTAWLADRGIPSGIVLNSAQVDQLLVSVREWYSSNRVSIGDKNEQLSECRFDYHFRYVTAQDYKTAKKRFEEAGYFYPAGNTEIVVPH
ncbi:MAG TPA: cell division protein ZapB [Gemmatimonadaceae bacterium]|nr:cell division protein ZapB [Gemmatimonadaceae bacterium]